MDEQRENDGNAKIQRRTVVTGLAVAGVAVGVGVLVQRSASDGSTPSTPPDLGPIEPGAALQGIDAHVVTIYPITLGALPVVLQTGGRRYQVDVLARDSDGPPGVGNTEHFSVYVSNSGDGDAPTDEAQGLGAMALARGLEAHVNAGGSMPELLTLRAREAKHPRGTFGVPLT